MNGATQLEHRASSRLGKHEGEPSLGLCDRLDRTRDNSQRQLPTDHDYAVPTREYQTDQSSLKPAQAAARSVLGERQRQLQKQPHRSSGIDTVTPYQAEELIEMILLGRVQRIAGEKRVSSTDPIDHPIPSGLPVIRGCRNPSSAAFPVMDYPEVLTDKRCDAEQPALNCAA